MHACVCAVKSSKTRLRLSHTVQYSLSSMLTGHGHHAVQYSIHSRTYNQQIMSESLYSVQPELRIFRLCMYKSSIATVARILYTVHAQLLPNCVHACMHAGQRRAGAFGQKCWCNGCLGYASCMCVCMHAHTYTNDTASCLVTFGVVHVWLIHVVVLWDVYGLLWVHATVCRYILLACMKNGFDLLSLYACMQDLEYMQ